MAKTQKEQKTKLFCVLDFKDFYLVLKVYGWPWKFSWLSTVTDVSETISSFLQKSRTARMHQPS